MAEKSNVPYDTISRLSVSTQSIFNKCCCCIPLRIGCLFLGYLNLVINVFQTLTLIAVTTFIGLTTHGFDHFNTERPLTTYPDAQSADVTEIQDLEKPILTQVEFLLIVMLIANASWLIINIACLVGLHKKRPGPIRVYVGFATARLLLSLAVFIYVVMSSNAQAHGLITHSIDLGLTAYFIFVYYIYAVQLEKEREAEIAQPAPVNNIFIYPTKLDKSHLVE